MLNYTCISLSDTLNNATGSADEILEKYSLGLTTLLNRHAPVIHRTITLRPNTSWYTEALRDAKRCRRTKERKWRRTNSKADRLQYRQQCAVVAKQLSDTKTEYLSDKITTCNCNPKLLHKLIDKSLVN